MITNEKATKIVSDFQNKYIGAKNLTYLIANKPKEVYGDNVKEHKLDDIKGAYHPKLNAVILFIDNAKDDKDFNQTLRHEVLGHYALNTLLPENKKKLLTSVVASKHEPSLKDTWEEVEKTYPDISELRKAEEVYAYVAEEEYPPEIVPSALRGKFNFDEQPLNRQQLRLVTKAVSLKIQNGTSEQLTFPQSDYEQFKKKPPSKKPYYETVAKTLIKQLEEGTAPWQKPWEEGVGLMPQNPTTGARYKGINAIWLSAQGKTDPRWMTYKQAQSVNAQVRKGESGTRIEYYKFEEEKIKRDDNGKPVFDKEGNKVKVKVKLDKPKVFSASVFNAEQVEGLPEFEVKKASWKELERAENILKGSQVKIEHDQADRAYYSPSKDEIHLPPKNQFEDAGKYYATALHELGHSTGHPSRLDRELSGGSESYSKEELRAEISSLMVGNELGTGHEPGQHASYIKSWVKVLKEDPKEIVNASKDAEKITELVLSYEKVQEKITESKPESNLHLKLAEKMAEKFTNESDKERFLEHVKIQSENLTKEPTLKIKEEIIKPEAETER